MKISVVVPCHNEEQVIKTTYNRLKATLASMDVETDLVFVDDGSSDGTWAELLDIRKDSPSTVKLVSFSRNFGHQMAITAGMSYATGDFILLIDADLQDPPELLPDMLEVALRGYDVVYGVRRTRGGEGVFKKVSAYLFYRLLNFLARTDMPADSGDFRLLSRKALDNLLKLPERHRYIRGLVSWVGFRQYPFEYDRKPRLAGETKYTFLKMVSFSMDALISFSAFPLRLATIFGCTFSVGSMLFFLYVLYIWFVGLSVPGWSSLIAVIIFIGGIQMIILGITGEYIGRIYEEIKGRPLYIVSEVLKDGDSDGEAGQ